MHFEKDRDRIFQVNKYILLIFLCTILIYFHAFVKLSQSGPKSNSTIMSINLVSQSLDLDLDTSKNGMNLWNSWGFFLFNSRFSSLINVKSEPYITKIITLKTIKVRVLKVGIFLLSQFPLDNSNIWLFANNSKYLRMKQ